MNSRAGVDTAATTELGKHEIPFAVHQYEASTALATEGDSLPVDGFDDPSRVFRATLMEVDRHPVCVLSPLDQSLEPAKVAAAVGGTTTKYMSKTKARKLTGYDLEAVAPVGTHEQLDTVIDPAAVDFKTIYISSGKPGFVIELSPADLIEITRARLAPITR